VPGYTSTGGIDDHLAGLAHDTIVISKLGLWTAVLLTACGGTSGGHDPGSNTGTDASPSGSGGQGGRSGNGGSIALDGSSSTGGAGGSAGGVPGGGPTLAGTATRPELTDADAPSYTVLRYLAQAGTIGSLVTDNWDPTAGLGDVSTFAPTFTVGPSGTYATVQAAIDAAAAADGTSRVYILVEPGTYREVVCVRTPVPITLYGADPDASKVVIVHDNYATKTNDGKANPCKPPSQTATAYGTGGSATFAVYSREFQAKNLTVSNDYIDSPEAQAVALLTSTDKIVLENVRLLGNQDTFYITTGGTPLVTRLYMKNGYVEGDTDFVFGRGTLVLDGVTINALNTKTGGTPLAPSTAPGNDYGFLVINSDFTAEAGLAANSTLPRPGLGRECRLGLCRGHFTQRAGAHSRLYPRSAHPVDGSVVQRRDDQARIQRDGQPPLRIQEHGARCSPVGYLSRGWRLIDSNFGARR
jgi:pectinesterase